MARKFLPKRVFLVYRLQSPTEELDHQRVPFKVDRSTGHMIACVSFDTPASLPVVIDVGGEAAVEPFPFQVEVVAGSEVLCRITVLRMGDLLQLALPTNERLEVSCSAD